jgi:hypothetical protein
LAKACAEFLCTLLKTSAMWQDIAKDWENIPLETYQFIYSQAKERFDEVHSESESITQKAFTLTSLTVGAVSGFVAYNLKTTPNAMWIVLLSFLFVGNVFCLIKLLFPKGVVLKGSPPTEIFNDYLDNSDLNQEEKKIVVYYHELVRYQERIELMTARNSRRHLFYGISLSLTALTIIITVGAVVSTIYSHP